MNSVYSHQAAGAMAPSEARNGQRDHVRTDNFLYQAAIVLAILLLLISF